MCGACRVSVGNETKFACVHGPDFDVDVATSRDDWLERVFAGIALRDGVRSDQAEPAALA